MSAARKGDQYEIFSLGSSPGKAGLAKLLAMGLPRDAASTLLERHMVVRYPKGAPVLTRAHHRLVFAVLTEWSRFIARGRAATGCWSNSRAGDLVDMPIFSRSRRAIADVDAAALTKNCCVAIVNPASYH